MEHVYSEILLGDMKAVYVQVKLAGDAYPNNYFSAYYDTIDFDLDIKDDDEPNNSGSAR